MEHSEGIPAFHMTFGEDNHGAVLDVLGRHIATGKRGAGSVMTLAGLEEEFDVSRTVVREVIKVLEGLGMVQARRRVGITVQPRATWNLLDRRVISWRMYDETSRRRSLLDMNSLRRAMEPEAARLAAELAPESSEHLIELAARMKELGTAGKGSSPEFLAIDTEFHELITQLSGNELFAHLGTMIGSLLIERTHWEMQPAFPNMAAMEHHIRLARAIHDGDPEAARASASFIVVQADDEVRDGVTTHERV